MSTYSDSLTLTLFTRLMRPVATIPASIGSGSRKRILCLDDDLLSLKLLERLLRDAYEVHLCSNVQQAVRIVEMYPIDTFICDYHLDTDMTGTKALQTLSAMELFNGCNSILITACPTAEIEAEVRAAGFTGIFPKPLGRAFQLHCKAL